METMTAKATTPVTVIKSELIEERILNLCDVLDIDLPKIDSIIPLRTPGHSSIELGISINPDFVLPKRRKPNYGLTLQWLLNKLQSKGLIRNVLEGTSANKTKMDQLTYNYLMKCLRIGPLIVFPINTGERWSTNSISTRNQLRAVERMRQQGDWVEFPLDSVSCLCSLATRKDEPLHMPICGGDVFKATRKLDFTPKISKEDSFSFGLCRDEKVCSEQTGQSSVWTGFAIR